MSVRAGASGHIFRHLFGNLLTSYGGTHSRRIVWYLCEFLRTSCPALRKAVKRSSSMS